MPFFDYLPKHANPFHIFLRHERVYSPFSHFIQEVMRGPSPFSEAERELIASYTSGLNDCDFCHGSHLAAAKALGVPHKVLESLMDDIDAAPVDEKMRPVLRLTRKLTLEPARVVQTDLEAVKAAGWDDQALHDIMAVCGLFNYMNRLVFGHGIELAPTGFDEGGKLLARFGYRLPPRWNLLARFMMKKNMATMAKE